VALLVALLVALFLSFLGVGLSLVVEFQSLRRGGFGLGAFLLIAIESESI
jgi:hypothetical protein